MSNNATIRVRIAPSPTGSLHVGTARSALYNYLFAKQNGGTFVLRIEDTDLERSDEKYTRDIMEGLLWLGIEWDEGPTLDGREKGKHGPYKQSARTEIYQKYLKKLIADGKVYPCYCTPEELEQERAAAAKKGESPKYSGKCRNLTEAEQKKLAAEGRNSILRFKTPAQVITFPDEIRGKVVFETDLIGDFSIARDQQTPLYNLAVVIDDYTMKISHVIRGEDHLSNTPKQILLQEALGFPRPIYAHLPLILNEDRSKL
ncbi:MAG: glutamate--tRNA ligase, partial [Candidatus Kerfeldbacteria bacterium CG_4_10_14_0_8_um_filter_42_10]